MAQVNAMWLFLSRDERAEVMRAAYAIHRATCHHRQWCVVPPRVIGEEPIHQ